MNKLALLWLFIGVGIGSILFQGELIQLSDAIYSIPPTPAFKTFEGINNNTAPLTGVLKLNATSSTDTLFLISDGSININLTVFP